MPDAFAAFRAALLPPADPLRAAITAATHRDEATCVAGLLARLSPHEPLKPEVDALAGRLITAMRRQPLRAGGVAAFMQEFSLASQEGVALMCLAEALLRIPDTATRDALIRDKLRSGDWRAHLGHSEAFFVNAAAWGLVLTGELLSPVGDDGLAADLHRVLQRSGEPVVRRAVDLALRLLGGHFVAGRNIGEALANAREERQRGYRHSFDMLGEAALTQHDAARYTEAYAQAIDAVGAESDHRGPSAGPGVSIKLSALHPRYRRAQRDRVMKEMLPRLQGLARQAAGYEIGFNIDAEEAERLELSLDLFEALARDSATREWQGLGFVVQAYQKRAIHVVEWLADLARRHRRRLMVRLVKGAYWDTEIRRAQVEGLPDYPVFTRKPHTDLSYLACAQRLLECADFLYPQFATHNAHTAASVQAMARAAGVQSWEFQCLHGMGAMYDELAGEQACRIYAPVGPHESLLAYLVRRLMENGANTSFVGRVIDARHSVPELLEHPATFARRHDGLSHPRIPPPARVFGAERKNSAGIDLTNENTLRVLAGELSACAHRRWQAAPGVASSTRMQPITSPADSNDLVGTAAFAGAETVGAALDAARHAASGWWSRVPATMRAGILERAADMLEEARAEFIALAVREAGKTLPNAVGEVREAADFLRYYASRLRYGELPGTPRGVIACISPWNFPLAIFTGQIAAALAAGNCAIAKPAEQTPLIAARMTALLHAAGIPHEALILLPGDGDVGAALVEDPRIDGVMFTGSEAVVASIRDALAAQEGERMLIAETGGVNAMIVDATALPEQAVQDILSSAFDSAGQRCSALRVLCIQEDVAPRILTMLRDAMRELRIGAPGALHTDIGPLIDEDARARCAAHVENMRANRRAVTQLDVPDSCRSGIFYPPTLIEVDSYTDVPDEVFGPILHVVRWSRDGLDVLLDTLHASGYGLTMGVHSRIDATVERIRQRARVGNLYVNRNMIGAVVGVQPFGGEGRSGTGPKAGGPLMLHRLRRDHHVLPECQTERQLGPGVWHLPGPAGEDNRLYFVPREADGHRHALENPLPVERCVTRNLAATGGSVSLLTLDE